MVIRHALAKPAEGHRKIRTLTRHAGDKVSQPTVPWLLPGNGLTLRSKYQKQHRQPATNRKAASARTPTGPNQVRQFDFSEFETTQGGT